MNERQRWAVERAAATGQVRNRDVRERFGVSTEAARQDLIGLVRDRVLYRRGQNSGAHYVIGEQNTRARVVASVLGLSRGELAAVQDLLRRLVSRP